MDTVEKKKQSFENFRFPIKDTEKQIRHHLFVIHYKVCWFPLDISILVNNAQWENGVPENAVQLVKIEFWFFKWILISSIATNLDQPSL